MRNKKIFRRKRIKKRIRSKINGSSVRPRMVVYKSNREIYVQLVDDTTGKTLVAASSKDKSANKNVKGKNKTEQAKLVGAIIAGKAVEKGIKTVVFDRNGFLYHGRLKALADAARENGLTF